MSCIAYEIRGHRRGAHRLVRHQRSPRLRRYPPQYKPPNRVHQKGRIELRNMLRRPIGKAPRQQWSSQRKPSPQPRPRGLALDAGPLVCRRRVRQDRGPPPAPRIRPAVFQGGRVERAIFGPAATSVLLHPKLTSGRCRRGIWLASSTRRPRRASRRLARIPKPALRAGRASARRFPASTTSTRKPVCAKATGT